MSIAVDVRRRSFSDPLKKRCLDNVRHLDFLGGCSEGFLDQLAMALEIRIAMPGETIFDIGDDAYELFILWQGKAEAIEIDGQKRKFTDGDVIGSPTLLFSTQRRAYKVVTAEMSEFQVLSRKEFQAALTMHPGEVNRIAQRLELNLGGRKRQSAHAHLPPGVTPPKSLAAQIHQAPAAPSPSPPLPNRRGSNQMSVSLAMKAGPPESHTNIKGVVSAVTASKKSRASIKPGRGSVINIDQAQAPRASVNPRGSIASFMNDQPFDANSGPRGSLAPQRASLAPQRASMVPRRSHAPSLIASQAKQDEMSTLRSWAYCMQEDDEASRRELAAWLDSIPFFQKMDAFFVERLLPLFEKRRFKTGETILAEGTPTEALHVLYAGLAKVFMNGNHINTIGPQTIVGERAIVAVGDQDARSIASIVCASPVVVSVALPKASLLKLLHDDPLMHRHFEDQFDHQKRERGERGFGSIRLFQHCEPQFIKVLEQRFINEDAEMITQGETSTEGFLLCLGTVHVWRNGNFLHEIAVEDFADGVILGEGNLLGMTRIRTTSVIAVTPCRVQVIFQQSLRRILDQFPAESIVFRGLVERRDIDKPPVPPPSSQPEMRRSAWEEIPEDCIPSSPRLSCPRVGGSILDERETGVRVVPPSRPHSSKLKRIKNKIADDTITCANKLHNLGEVKHLSDCSIAFLQQLDLHMGERLYMPEQVLMQEGEEMTEVHVLQQGACTIAFHGEELAAIEGPSLVGSLMALMTATVVTTVVAKKTCLVATISKRDFAAVLDDHPEDRKHLFALAQHSFSEQCDDFLETMGKDLRSKLAALPILKGSSDDFIAMLAEMINPKLMLPGQIVTEEGEEKAGEDEAKLYILFEGFCHLINGSTVVGTLRSGTMFGEMDVFGIDDGGRKIVVKTVELCKVGIVTKERLFKAITRFPKERVRIEKLVHNRLEESVYARVVQQPCFEGLQSSFLSKVCLYLDRRLCYADEIVIREGAPGESMFIVNRGKAELSYNGIVIGMLWPGKAFGAAQLLGIAREYHATLRAKRTCHLLAMCRKSLSAITVGAQERQWMMSWQQQAKAAYESEVKVFKRKFREHRRMVRVGFNIFGETDKVFLLGILTAWARQVRSTKEGAEKSGEAVDPRRARFTAGGKKLVLGEVGLPRAIEMEAKDYLHVAAPIKFSRGLQRVELEVNGAGVTSTDAWRHWGQSGRLDIWKGIQTPVWLAAVREEIPKQLMALKAEARGEASRLPGLMMY